MITYEPMLVAATMLSAAARGGSAASILGPLAGIVCMLLVIVAFRTWMKRMNDK